MKVASTAEGKKGEALWADGSLRRVVSRLAYSPYFIAAAAFALRLAILYLVWDKVALSEFTGPYGYEEGCVAKSIALGHGFSSPLPLVQTGPTAYLCPIYPYILAGVFKIWGIYSFESHVVAQVLNCLFVSLTIFPIFAVAKRSFGFGTAVLASWLWVVFPNAWHIPIADVWDTSLTVLWFALLFLATLELRERSSFRAWVGYGALWAAGGLINATLLSVMAPFFLWLIWEARKEAKPWLQTTLAAAVTFVVVVAPWTIRNYRTFGEFIPMRSTLGQMLWVGNNPDAVGTDSFASTVVWDRNQAEEFKRVGEIAYMQREQQEAIAFIRTHPKATLRNIAERIFAFWFSVTDRVHDELLADPLYVKALFLFNLVVVLGSLVGVGAAWHDRNRYVLPYFCVLMAFPLVYYLTCALVRYRFLMDPILTILASFAVSRLLVRRGPVVSEKPCLN